MIVVTTRTHYPILMIVETTRTYCIYPICVLMSKLGSYVISATTTTPMIQEGNFLVRVDNQVCIRASFKASFEIKYASLGEHKRVRAFYLYIMFV